METSSPQIFVSHSWSEHEVRSEDEAGKTMDKVKHWISHTSFMPQAKIGDKVFNRPLLGGGPLGQYVVVEGTNPLSGSQLQVREKLLNQISSTDLVVLLIDSKTMRSNFIAWEVLCARLFVEPKIPIFGIQYKESVFDPEVPRKYPIEKLLFSYVNFFEDDFLSAGALMQNIEGIISLEKRRGRLFCGKQRNVKRELVDLFIERDDLIEFIDLAASIDPRG